MVLYVVVKLLIEIALIHVSFVVGLRGSGFLGFRAWGGAWVLIGSLWNSCQM